MRRRSILFPTLFCVPVEKESQKETRINLHPAWQVLPNCNAYDISLTSLQVTRWCRYCCRVKCLDNRIPISSRVFPTRMF